MFRSLFKSGVQVASADRSSIPETRHRRLVLNTFLAACVAFCLGVIVPDHAVAVESFSTDIYIAVPPAEEQLDGESVDMVFFDGGTVVIPQSAFGNSGVIPFSDKFLGAKDLKKAIDKSFAASNKEFEKAGVKFEVRNIYFVSTKNKHIKDSFLSKDEPFFDLGISNKKSKLLTGFKKLTETKTDSFNILMAPLSEGDTSIEEGWAEDGGNTSVVDIGRATLQKDGGFILIHELGHNLGLDHHGSDPFTTAMAPQSPSRGYNETSKVAKPKLTDGDVSTIKKNVGKGTYKNYKKPATSSTTKKKKKTKSRAATKKKAVKKKSQKKQTLGSFFEKLDQDTGGGGGGGE